MWDNLGNVHNARVMLWYNKHYLIIILTPVNHFQHDTSHFIYIPLSFSLPPAAPLWFILWVSSYSHFFPFSGLGDNFLFHWVTLYSASLLTSVWLSIHSLHFPSDLKLLHISHHSLNSINNHHSMSLTRSYKYRVSYTGKQFMLSSVLLSSKSSTWSKLKMTPLNRESTFYALIHTDTTLTIHATWDMDPTQWSST